MKRRAFITLIGGAAAAWSSRAQAQRPAMPTIGFLSLAKEGPIRPYIEAFRSGLAALGHTEGKDILVLYRYADENTDRLSALTRELVSLGATIIVTSGAAAIRAAHDAAPNVPIVSFAGPTPVAFGWAQTWARPGGMVTGIFIAGSNDKRIELLKEVRPQATTFGLLMNATNPGYPVYRTGVLDAARALGISLEIIEVKDKSELPDAFDRMESLGVAGVAISSDAVLGTNAQAIAELARAHKFPSVGDGSFSAAGGLLTLSEDYLAMARHSASYVDQILKGIPPGDIPAELGRGFRLIVNLRTAKELGITIPPSVLARADQIID